VKGPFIDFFKKTRLKIASIFIFFLNRRKRKFGHESKVVVTLRYG
jgi:hypothetical protein